MKLYRTLHFKATLGMSSTALESSDTPVLGDGSTKPKNEFILRPIRFSDIHTLAVYTAEAYEGTPVMNFIAPKSYEHRYEFVRGFRQSIWRRAVGNRNLNLVACASSDPKTPLGYGQFVRLGDGNYRQGSRLVNRLFLFFLSWIIWILFSVENCLWPDRSCDQDAVKIFEGSHGLDTKRYWTSHPERKNRWYAQSIIVSPKWQRRGIGRMILAEALSRAQKEGVIMGLTGSPVGAKLYRSTGFQMLGDYTYRIKGDDEDGGIMIWYPDGMKESGKSE